MPLVSVIIACLNDLKHLPKAVDSVLGQNFTDIELVIMDGASKDGTPDYLKTLTDPRVTWRSEPDGGLTQAWNKAVGLARGDWLLFLGADDYIWDHGVIAKAAPLLQNSDARLAFGDVNIVAEHSDAIVQTTRFDREELLKKLRGAQSMGLPHQGFFHSRSAFDTGLFDTSFRLAADYEFITRFSAARDFLFLPIGPVAAFRMGGLSTKPWVSVEAYREVVRARRAHGESTWPVAWPLAKAHTKMMLRQLVGEGIARRMVNLARALRGLPPYSG